MDQLSFETGEVLYRIPTRWLWRARAMPLGLGASMAAMGVFFILVVSLSAERSDFGLVLLALALGALIVLMGITWACWQGFGLNRLTIAANLIVPPTKGLFRCGRRDLVIPWGEVLQLRRKQSLVSTPQEVSYLFTIQTRDGRVNRMSSSTVAALTRSTADMMIVYELLTAISEAFAEKPYDRLAVDVDLMTSLRELQKGQYAAMDLFSRTLASKLAMAGGGQAFVVGLLSLLIALPWNSLVQDLLVSLGLVVFLMGFATPRAFGTKGKFGREDQL